MLVLKGLKSLWWEETHNKGGTHFDTTPECCPSSEYLSVSSGFTSVSITLPPHPSLPPPSVGLFFICNIVSTVIPVVPQLPEDCDWGKQCLFLFWMHNCRLNFCGGNPAWWNSIIKVKFIGTQSLCRCFQLLHCAIGIYFRSQSKEVVYSQLNFTWQQRLKGPVCRIYWHLAGRVSDCNQLNTPRPTNPYAGHQKTEIHERPFVWSVVCLFRYTVVLCWNKRLILR